MDSKIKGGKMEKIEFLTRVAEVMKSVVSYEAMMESIKRSCLRSEAENIELLEREAERVDEVIKKVNGVDEIRAGIDTFDALVLRYLKNTQFLANIEEEYIDITGLDGDLAYWKKTLLYKVPSV